MIARVEACQNWLETITHQMNNVRPVLRGTLSCHTYARFAQMSYHEQSDKLAGAIGLLKQYVFPPHIFRAPDADRAA